MKAAARSAMIVKRHCVGANATPYCLISLLRALRAKNSLWIEFKPAKAILAYRESLRSGSIHNLLRKPSATHDGA